ncbi:N-acetylglucosaminyl-diphospho-decaprenol L-rhamnosyltransferase [Microbacterium lemovicicum]|uniref:N-acetylglucosaminyl-diphospho-decaprenol L-rhamnosyltransferase n=1 Tax=Microbacterium lemovicicum TaxID=1072463 RepID=A0A3S9W684_9MICO|nr:glycosyltransferase [Microbacterium lemovicicum]AZS35600.1 N-acetylglucosaminyl-diphospho-decaprenol L-rhamnosyltransferase [Microbacterium lemovicicum]
MSIDAGACAVLIVNYGSHELIRRNTMLSQLPTGIRVFVVDNPTTVEERAAVAALSEESGWRLLTPDENLGFGGGMNLAASVALSDGCQVLLALNPDAYLVEDATIRLLEYAYDHPRAIVAPRISRPDGRPFSSMMSLDLTSGSVGRADSGVTAGASVAWLSGACFAMSATLWRELDGFDDDYFLYWEDIDLSFRARSIGAELRLLEDAVAIHDPGGTQEQRGRAKSSIYYFFNTRNRLLFAAKHLPRADRMRWLARSAGEGYRILLRGGRHQLAAPRRSVLPVIRGTIAGAAAVLRSVRSRSVRPRSGQGLPHPAVRSQFIFAPRARLYETVRSAHLERAHQMAPAAIVYRWRRYDFDPSLTDGLEMVRLGRLSAGFVLRRSNVRELEINEPLMYASLPTSAIVIALVSFLRASHRRPRLVAYAIENSNPFAQQGGSVRARLQRRVRFAIARFVWRRIDRVVYGTESSRDLYRSLLGPSGGAEKVILALPARMKAGHISKPLPTVVFLGALVQRKGLPLLREAWPIVRHRLPDATLTVIGKGALQSDVEKWAAEDETVTFIADPPRATIRDELAKARVLVLPSQPSATWREQVGLPIVEGLQQGCAIVTTDQTGLATWLAERDHGVVSSPSSAGELASTIVTQLERGDRAVHITGSLPEEDGRLEADAWLFADESTAEGKM